MFRIQPDLRFPSFKDQWKKTVLGDISKRPMYGVGASAVVFNNKDVYVRITDIEDKSRKLMSRNFTSPSIVNQKYLLKDKDILFARTGASTGKTYIHENYEMKYDYYFAGFLIKFEILNSYYPDFIYQYTLTKSYENWVRVMSVRSGQPGINSEEYSKLKLNIPRYEEQKKIGDFFSKLDRQIELEEQKLEKLEEQKKGYMQKIFSQELRFKDEYGNDYPAWKEYVLGETGNTYGGLSSKTKDDFGYGDSYFITYMNVFKNTIAKANMIEKVNIQENEKQNKVNYKDILFTTSSEVPEETGMSSVWLYKENNVYLNSFCFGFRVTCDDIEPIYLTRFLRSKKMRKQITILSQGSTRFNISKKEVMKLKIDVPNLEEQTKIVNFLSEYDSLIESQSSKIGLLKKRKKGFLQKMFV